MNAEILRLTINLDEPIPAVDWEEDQPFQATHVVFEYHRHRSIDRPYTVLLLAFLPDESVMLQAENGDHWPEGLPQPPAWFIAACEAMRAEVAA